MLSGPGLFSPGHRINGYARAYQQMGLIYQKLGRERGNEGRLRNLADIIHMDRNQNNEAEEIFQYVLALRPDTTNVYKQPGHHLSAESRGRVEEAVKAYEKAMKVHPDDEYNTISTCSGASGS